MNFRQLQIFVNVCESGSMSETARNMYMTQPAVSQTIIDLESELNVKLFDRINRKLNLTYSGEILLMNSKRILGLVEDTKKELNEIANLTKGKIRIGASTTIGIYLLPALISEFNQIYGDINIPYVIDNTSVIQEMILNNKIDIGLVEGPVFSENIIVQHLVDDELYLICGNNHHWSRKKMIEPKDIKQENIIIREQGSGTRGVFEQAMLMENLPYQIKYELNSTEAIKKAVQANLGIAIVSRIAVENEIKAGVIKRVFLKGMDFKRPLNIIYHKDKFHSNIFDHFINFLSKSGKTTSIMDEKKTQ